MCFGIAYLVVLGGAASLALLGVVSIPAAAFAFLLAPVVISLVILIGGYALAQLLGSSDQSEPS